MNETSRPLDPQRDLPAVAAMLGRARANGGLLHPGGIQWWLRELGRPGFEAHVVDDGATLTGFVLIDDEVAILESTDPRQASLDLNEWTTDHMRSSGRESMRTPVVEASPLQRELERRGFSQVGTELELMFDVDGAPPRPVLPPGYRFASLADIHDDAFIEMHRAAWSDKRPSAYRRELHEAVKRMPQFRPDLVTIVIAPDGTPAAYCIGWYDQTSRTLEIEPLGTHRDFRRRHLAHAVVQEVIHRAYENGAQHVLVWNNPATNAPAYGLYTGAGMTARRRLAELALDLRNTNVVNEPKRYCA